MTSLNLSKDIIEQINNFISEGDNSKELEIIITNTNISLKDFINEISFLEVSKNNQICSLCDKYILIKQFKRTIKLCNHSFHKKCYENLIKEKINKNNDVNDTDNYCCLCNKTV